MSLNRDDGPACEVPPSTSPDGRHWEPVPAADTGDPVPDDDAPVHVTRDDMLATGATYRMLDYWTRMGYLQPDNDGRGAGTQRHWRPQDRDVARLMVRLIESGLHPRMAAQIANDGITHRVSSFSTEWGIRISWTPERTDA